MIAKQKNIPDKKSFIIPVLCIGGIATGLCYLFFQFCLAWVCLIPLFYALEIEKTNRAFLYGALFGAVTASVLYFWIFSVSIRYTGAFSAYPILFYLFAVAYFSLYCGVLGVGYQFLRSNAHSTILAGISIAGLYVLLDMLKLNLFPGLPWLTYNLAYTQSQNLWAVQWASLGGMPIIIFFIVLFNYFLTLYTIRGGTIFLKMAGGILSLFFVIGYLLARSNAGESERGLTVALLNENIRAETRWNRQTGDSLAHLFFKMNEDAATYNPDLIVWSETAVPWRFQLDDDFVRKFLSITYRSRADHLFGIFSPSPQNTKAVYNSAYLVRYDGNIIGRHDKTVLLDFLEKPFSTAGSFTLPFLGTSMYDNMLQGRSLGLLTADKTRIGALICNESLSERSWNRYVDAGADLLVVMSNDAWFENTPLITHHFYVPRLLALSTGRDVVVNSNRGINGIICASGALEKCEPADTARVICVKVNRRANRTIYSSVKDLNVVVYSLLVFLSLLPRRNKR